ncbi:MAG: beta-lactamase family protein [Frankia sp.]|nr:beta-lactamase family protein [Frankia sp.]
MDAAVLEEIAAVAEEGKSNCLIVVRDGRIAGEWYFRGTNENTTQNVFSVTKSVTSTLVGIAQDDGALRISDSASTWIPQWRGTPAEAVTVRNLLSNDSGRQWSWATDYAELPREQDQTAFAIGLAQEHPPGQTWAYNNSAIQTLSQVLAGATGQDPVDFAKQRLFEPIGMAHTTLGTDPSGGAQTYSGLRTTCRDLARFGQLVLDQGRWGDEQIVSAEWLAEATGQSSTAINAAYGYLWWLNRPGPIAGVQAASDLSAVGDGTLRHGQLVPGAPEDMFWAVGLGNQVVQIDPGSRTVVVRLGIPEGSPRPPTFGQAEASRVVTEAVTGPVPAGG